MSQSDPASPQILALDWGKMNVEGVGTGKDFKLWPGGGRAWDWNETGTRHNPGIQPADLEELVEHGCDVVVLSRGILRRLKTTPEAKAYLAERSVDYQIDETREAARIYNDLARQGRKVGGLFHSTC